MDFRNNHAISGVGRTRTPNEQFIAGLVEFGVLKLSAGFDATTCAFTPNELEDFTDQA